MADDITPMPASIESIQFLHLSDMHVGMPELRERWPRSDYVLSSDLDRLFKKLGGCGLIVFSGDLAFSGASEQYEQFAFKYDRILKRINELGGDPKLIIAPGNHDLERPDPMMPAAYALSQYWRDQALRERFWSGDSTYVDFVKGLFSQFAAFQAKLVADGLHLPPDQCGIFPGDASYTLEIDGCRVGIVCLNSAWLQTGAGEYEGQLHIDTKQLLAVTGENPDDWVARNAVNLLVTHHPHSWLHPQSLDGWNNDINPAGRFDLHLFGHMHEPATISVSVGGSLPRRNVQAPSLFGLETFGNGEVQRIQGYSGGRLEVDGENRVFTCWPRKLVRQGDGAWKFSQDTSQDIDEETGSFSINYAVQRSATPSGANLCPRSRGRQRALCETRRGSAPVPTHRRRPYPLRRCPKGS